MSKVTSIATIVGVSSAVHAGVDVAAAVEALGMTTLSVSRPRACHVYQNKTIDTLRWAMSAWPFFRLRIKTFILCFASVDDSKNHWFCIDIAQCLIWMILSWRLAAERHSWHWPFFWFWFESLFGMVFLHIVSEEMCVYSAWYVCFWAGGWQRSVMHGIGCYHQYLFVACTRACRREAGTKSRCKSYGMGAWLHCLGYRNGAKAKNQGQKLGTHTHSVTHTCTRTHTHTHTHTQTYTQSADACDVVKKNSVLGSCARCPSGFLGDWIIFPIIVRSARVWKCFMYENG